MRVTVTAQSQPDVHGAPVNYHELAQGVLGLIEWDGETKGYCKCPGHHLHTSKTGEKDCEVRLNDGRAPTIFCFHSSCKTEVERANRVLRSEIGKEESRLDQYLSSRRRSTKPAPKVEDDKDPTLQFLQYIFEPEDVPSIQYTILKEDGKGDEFETPGGGGFNVWTTQEWIDGIHSKQPNRHPASYAGDDAHGYYIRVNPVGKNTKGRDQDVTDFRYTLVESDEIPKPQQDHILRNSGLPIAALIDSGGKSIHAWVRVDATNWKEYRKRVEQIHDALPDEFKMDEKTANPSRFSRLPGAMRGEAEQKLIALGVGPSSFEEWMIENDDFGDEPEIRPIDLKEYDVKNDLNNVLGDRWLCRGYIFGFTGPTGIGKSTAMMQTMINWGLGRDFFGIQCKKPLKSYVLQYENDLGDLAEQFQGIVKGLKIGDHQVEQLNDQIIMRNSMKHVGMDILPLLRSIHRRHAPDILWLDPLMSYIGGDMSDAAYMSEWLQRMLVPFAKETGTIIGLVQHTGKPKDIKQVMKMTSTDMAYQAFGSSIIANACREMVNVTRLKMPDGEPWTFRIDLCKRAKRSGLKNIKGQSVGHNYMRHASHGICWELADDPSTMEVTQ